MVLLLDGLRSQNPVLLDVYKRQVLGVVYFIVVDAAHRYFNGAGGDVVHEFAAVSYTHLDVSKRQP